MHDKAAQNSWLTELGRVELRLIKELGYNHPDVLEAQSRFRDAYQIIKAIRNAYDSPSAQENNS
jgi:hypothetical protein